MGLTVSPNINKLDFASYKTSMNNFNVFYNIVCKIRSRCVNTDTRTNTHVHARAYMAKERGMDIKNRRYFYILLKLSIAILWI